MRAIANRASVRIWLAALPSYLKDVSAGDAKHHGFAIKVLPDRAFADAATRRGASRNSNRWMLVIAGLRRAPSTNAQYILTRSAGARQEVTTVHGGSHSAKLMGLDEGIF